ncbi:MAG: hypothetical protein LUC16_03685, partial [Coprobacillus sp.]|nr:hypothetical protein [Coprobacillus sp.]
DPSNFCELTIAIKNTNASQNGFTTGLTPQFYHWVSEDSTAAFVNMTQGACGSYTSSNDYYFTIDTTNGASDGGSKTYRVAKGEGFSFQVSCSNTTNQWASAIHLTDNISWSTDLPLSNNSSDGAINISEGYLNHDSVLVVLGFDFATYESKEWNETAGLYNIIVTEAQFVIDWNAES